MKDKSNEPIFHFLELAEQMNYFTKLQPNAKNTNSFKTDLEITSYSELSHSISSLLRTSISILKNDPSEVGIEVMLLIEIAYKLLPHDEMELLDELYPLIKQS
jgi:hypothetical protein